MKWILFAALAAIVAGGALVAIEHANVVPRRLAPYVERRAEGHGTVIERFGRTAANVLSTLDRGAIKTHEPMPVPFPGDALFAPRPTPGDDAITVRTPDEALHAIAAARPGDAITFLPGVYRFTGKYIDVRRPGAAGAPISVRADKASTVLLQFDMLEGFLVSAPYWSFENLAIQGVCADHSSCEHAFHIVGGADHFLARNLDVRDFNAHFKINGSGGSYPDFGVIANNSIHNSGPRNTGNPVTTIDLVAASHWRIRGNRISDFIKTGSDQISYGAFVKGGGADNRFEQNVVVCENRLRGLPGQRVGLSLGGGGSSAEACRNRHCITEQDEGAIVANLIASCSDDGIYLNRAARSRVSHNTLIDTGGITARFGETAADVEGNLVDGAIRALSGASLHERDNRTTALSALYLGWHPARRWFIDALALDLRWRADPPRRQNVDSPLPDLCGAPRPRAPTYGAFEDIARCAVAK